MALDSIFRSFLRKSNQQCFELFQNEQQVFKWKLPGGVILLVTMGTSEIALFSNMPLHGKSRSVPTSIRKLIDYFLLHAVTLKKRIYGFFW